MAAVPAGLADALQDRYHLERELGAGGMATVYLAKDLKHNREVALKVLRPELAAILGPDRFLKEIETTANLQHPHILPLFDSGQAGAGPDRPSPYLFYVMPFIEGESLRDRLNREKQLPIPDAVRITTEVASALDYAHRHGVIHRDIKPENILLHDGQALVADFGIALALEQAGGSRLTETGLSLGTPHYMSPEQGAGDRALDARSDLYSLACVLYELLAGEPPFTGATLQAITSRKLSNPMPSLRTVRELVPAGVEAAICRALAKSPADRYQTARQFAEALEHPDPAAAVGESGPHRSTLPAQRGLQSLALWRTGAAVALVAAIIAVIALITRPRGGEPVRLTIQVPALAITSHQPSPVVVFSPDGQTLAFVSGGGGTGRIYLRRLDSFEAAPIKGIDNAQGPDFSPDGQWLAFVDESDGKLKKVRLSDATVLPLCEAKVAHGVAWGPDGTIIFGASMVNRWGLSRVSADGGTPELLLSRDSLQGEMFLVHPSWLPSGDAVLFAIDDGSGKSLGISVLDLRTRRVTKLLTNGDNPRYLATGHLLYARDSALYAVPFDPKSRRVMGTPRLVEPNVMTGWYQEPSQGHFAVSASGVLAYVRGEPDTVPRRDRVAIVTRAGAEELLGDPRSPPDGEQIGNIWDVRWSPDGAKLLVVQMNQGPSTATQIGYRSRLWVWDIQRRTARDLSGLTPNDFAAVWMPDGASLVVQRSEALRTMTPLWLRRADGTGVAKQLTTVPADAPPQTFQNPAEVTPDGRTLLFQQHVGGHNRRIWALSLSGDRQARQMPNGADEEWGPTLSPNGRWLAFLTGSGLVVTDYPAAARRFPLARNAVTWPRWSGDGRELLYGALEHGVGAIWSIPVNSGAEFSFGAPTILFRTQLKTGTFTSPDFEVSRDGQRFLIVKPGGIGATLSRIAVVVNWTSGLMAPQRAP